MNYKINNIKIGERIRSLREQMSMSREKFSEMIDSCCNMYRFKYRSWILPRWYFYYTYSLHSALIYFIFSQPVYQTCYLYNFPIYP